MADGEGPYVLVINLDQRQRLVLPDDPQSCFNMMTTSYVTTELCAAFCYPLRLINHTGEGRARGTGVKRYVDEFAASLRLNAPHGLTVIPTDLRGQLFDYECTTVRCSLKKLRDVCG